MVLVRQLYPTRYNLDKSMEKKKRKKLGSLSFEIFLCPKKWILLELWTISLAILAYLSVKNVPVYVVGPKFSNGCPNILLSAELVCTIQINKDTSNVFNISNKFYFRFEQLNRSLCSDKEFLHFAEYINLKTIASPHWLDKADSRWLIPCFYLFFILFLVIFTLFVLLLLSRGIFFRWKICRCPGVSWLRSVR